MFTKLCSKRFVNFTYILCGHTYPQGTITYPFEQAHLEPSLTFTKGINLSDVTAYSRNREVIILHSEQLLYNFLYTSVY